MDDQDDAPYYERRERLRALLESYDEPVTCGELADAFDASTHEVRAKLMSLRAAGEVAYHARAQRWSARIREAPVGAAVLS